MGLVEKDETVRSGWHWEFGWLRRPDMDDHHGYCYEEPDGDLVFFGDKGSRIMVYLDQRVDRKTGDNYLCMHPTDPPVTAVRRMVKLYMKIRPSPKVKR